MKQNNQKMTFKFNEKEEQESKKSEPEKLESNKEDTPHETIDLVEKRREWEENPQHQDIFEKKPVRKPPGLPFHRKRKLYSPRKSNRNDYALDKIKITGLITAALLLGVLFGLPLVQIVTTSSPTNSAEENLALQGETVPASTAAEVEEDVGALSLDFVQAGAFSSAQAGQTVQTEMETQGYPSVMHDAADSEYVFLYIDMTKAGSAEETVVPDMEAEGFDVYVKSLTVDSLPNDSAEELQTAAAHIEEHIVQALDEPRLFEPLDQQALEAVSESNEQGAKLVDTLDVLTEEYLDKSDWMQLVLDYEAWVSSL